MSTLTQVEMEHEEGDPSIAGAAVEAGMRALMSCAPPADAADVVISVIDWLHAKKYEAPVKGKS